MTEPVKLAPLTRLLNWIIHPWGLVWRPQADRREFISDEAAFEQEMAEADRLTPDWDRAMRIDSVLSALDRGMDPGLVRAGFGEDIYLEALLQATREVQGAPVAHPSLVPTEARSARALPPCKSEPTSKGANAV